MWHLPLTNIVACGMLHAALQIINNNIGIAISVYRMVVVGGGGGWSVCGVVVLMLHLAKQARWCIVGAHLAPRNKTIWGV